MTPCFYNGRLHFAVGIEDTFVPQEGVGRRKLDDAVAAYAATVAERYSGSLDIWTPLNEPVINAVYCGERGTWPPYLRGDDGFAKVLTRLARGMILTQRRIAEVQPSATFVHVDAGFRWTGAWPPGEREHLEERRFLGLDLVLGRVDEAHPMRNYLTRHGVTDTELDWFTANAVTPDVIGVNYYPAFTTAERAAGTGTVRPVEAGTAGLTDLLHRYADRYEQPLFLTETSRGGPVDERLAWLEESVETVRRLRADGMRLVGYTWFPFFALVDWLYRESKQPVDHWLVQMGLYDLERDAGSVLPRRATGLVDRFRALAAQNAAER